MSFTNPFGADRIEVEKTVLAGDFSGLGYVWSLRANLESENKNVNKLKLIARPMVYELRERLRNCKTRASDDDLLIYKDLVGFVLYHRYRRHFAEMVIADLNGTATSTQQISFFEEFQADAHYLYDIPKSDLRKIDLAHLFACFFSNYAEPSDISSTTSSVVHRQPLVYEKQSGSQSSHTI